MNAILKSKSTRLLSALLAVLMIVAMLPTSAFAWSAEEGTKCTSTYGDKYLGSDGDNYYSKAGNTLFYNDDGSFYVSYHSGGVARYKYLMIDSNGTSHTCTALSPACPTTTATPTIPPAVRTASIFRTCPSLLSSEL